MVTLARGAGSPLTNNQEVRTATRRIQMPEMSGSLKLQMKGDKAGPVWKKDPRRCGCNIDRPRRFELLEYEISKAD